MKASALAESGAESARSTLSPRISAINVLSSLSKLDLGERNASDETAQHAKSFRSMDEFVLAMGGRRAIKKILVANNGIAAVKCIRSIRRWLYEVFGSDKLISFVAMATPEDLQANAEYIHLADEFVRVPGGSNNHNYKNILLIREVAERCGADAVWAGWGHASENPKLPEELAKSKRSLIWIGPPPSAMRALGDKIGSTIIAQSVSVPCMPWSGQDIRVNYASTGIPSDVYQRACVRTVEEAAAAAQRIGYPIMIKASEGGGGKGIRKVERAEALELAFNQVLGEVPGSPVFLMKLAPVARHLEVQLLCDEWGDAIAVFGRDCSVQRRHQKIIEEGPVVAAPQELWREMERSAVRLAKEVGYVGVGTVEYLFTPNNQYYFLELNARLQVEHPVTELISGVNLPAAQVQVAMGIPLHRLPGVRKMYRKPPFDDSRIDFARETAFPLPGHVIACRITAENPDQAFQPTSGVIRELNFRSTPDVWGYFSVGSQGGVHEYSDSQFGHVFALGETREIARRNMIVALRELSIRGDIRTTVEYLPKVMETDDFRNNNVDTTWLERVMAMQTVQREKPDRYRVVLLGALYRAFTASTATWNDYMRTLERGQMPSEKLHSELVEVRVMLIYDKVKYSLVVCRSGPNSYDVTPASVGTSKGEEGDAERVSGGIGWGPTMGAAATTTATATAVGAAAASLGPSGHAFSAPRQPQERVEAVAAREDAAADGEGKGVTVARSSGRLQHESKRSISLRSGDAHITAAGDAASAAPSVMSADVHHLADGGLLVLLGGKKHVVYGQDFPTGLRLVVDGMTCLFSVEYDPSLLRSSMAGKLVRFIVADGTHVDKGAPYAEMEVMKMYLTLTAPESGVIRVVRPEGTVVEAGDLIARLQLDDPSRVERAEEFRGQFPPLDEGTSQLAADRPNVLLVESLRRLEMLLSGYKLGAGVARRSLETMMQSLRNPRLPLFQFEECVSALAGRVPDALYDELMSIAHDYAESVSQNKFFWEGPSSFPVADIFSTIDAQLVKCNEREQAALRGHMAPLFDLLERYRGGNHLYAARVVNALLEQYFNVEFVFNGPNSSPESVIKELRRVHRDKLANAMGIAMAHHQLAARSELVVWLLSGIETELWPLVAEFAPVLQKLASLQDKAYASVVLRARQLLSKMRLPSPQQRRIAIQTILQTAAQSATLHERLTRLAPLIDQSRPISDMIFAFFERKSSALRSAALEVYVRRMYQMYTIQRLDITTGSAGDSPSQSSSPRRPSRGASFSASGGKAPSALGTVASGSLLSTALQGASASALVQHSATPSKQFSMIAMPSSASSLPSNAPSVGVVSSATGPAGARIDVLKARWEFSVDVDRLHMELRHESTRPVAMSAAAQTSLSPTATGPSASPSAKPTTTMRRVVSVTDLRNVDAGSARDTHEPEQQAARQLVAQQSSSAGPADARVVPRVGVMAYCHTFDELKQSFSHLLDEFPDTKTDARPPTAGGELEPVHVLYVSFVWGQRLPSDDQLSELFSSFLRGFRETLLRSGVRRVTFVVPHGDNYPFYFTYRHHLDYREDRITRHVEPSLSLFLELNRLSNFALELVPTTNRMVHLFEGRPLSPLRGGSGASVGASIGESDGRRLFARVIVRQVDSHQFADELAGDSKVDEASASGGPNEVLVSAVGAKGRRLSTTDEVERELDLDAHPETEVAFVEALAAIETAMGGDRTRHLSNTILINVLVEAQLSVDYISRVIRMLARRYSEKIQLLNIASVEFLLRIKRTSLPPHRLASDDDAEPDRGKPSDAASAVTSAEAATVRFVCSNPTGAMLLIHVYEQRRDQRTGEVRLHALDADAGAPLDGLNIETPVPVSQPFEKQRLLARAAGTTWVYDLLTLLEKAARQLWRRAGKDRLGAGSRVLEATELVLSAPSKADEGEGGENGADAKETMQDATEGVSGRRTFDGTLPQVLRGRQRLVEVQRPAGQNTIGMVAWSVKLRLPFDDAAREVILIANDVTFQAGTFGTQEDVLFKLASSRARELGIARLYVAANSGARIGLADEIKGKFRVAWLGDDPLRGVEYLYLSDADYQANPRSAVCERRQVGEEVRWVIRDIIGAKGDLGVENLQGSGMIAGETSSAFDEIFTLSYVTGRTVGIGSYLVRLGQRCIQRKGSPIILTGYQALNKLLGRAVYSSNTQLGGVEIMFTNGVSHLVVEDDLEGVLAMLRWLSYVPSHRGLTMRAACSDPVERAVGWRPSKEGYDASLLMEGWVDPATGEWQSGFFDRGSFLEILGGWARTVVVGRARLGGVAMGVIAVGTQAVEQTYPADPAAPESKENSVLRAAQVWFPDSAYKTAQAVRDMAAEDLPIMIFANWRGFSGGMQDMLDEVLKFGSYIVDHLRSYRKPIFIYLPPFATLRGGAWVVVDPTINRPFMEMYADEQSRGGVLEPEGTVDVKFRHADVCAMAHRVDPVLCNLDRELSALDARSPEADALRKRVREREALVLPICHQVATTFADLHDTPGRMLAKGVIRACVRWEDSRHFFYLRLVRRLAECEVVGRISAALSEVMATEAPSQSRGSVPRGSAATDFESQWDRALSALRSWLASDVGAQRVDEVWNSDSAMTEWLASRKSLLDAQVRNLQERGIAERLRATAQRDPAAFAQLVTQSLSGLGAPAIESLRAALSGFGAFRSQSQ